MPDAPAFKVSIAVSIAGGDDERTETFASTPTSTPAHHRAGSETPGEETTLDVLAAHIRGQLNAVMANATSWVWAVQGDKAFTPKSGNVAVSVYVTIGEQTESWSASYPTDHEPYPAAREAVQ